jgi:O-antigen/teichoic acid export membrane protein
VGVSFMFSRGLNNYFRPRALDAYQTGGGKALRSTLIRMAMILSSYMLLVSLAFAMIGGILMVLVYGERFHDTGPLVCLLSFVSLATSLSMVGDNGVIALRRPDLSLWAELSNGTVTIILALGLVSPFGLYGVACAMLIGQIVGAGVLGYCVWTLTKRQEVGAGSVQTERWSAEAL